MKAAEREKLGALIAALELATADFAKARAEHHAACVAFAKDYARMSHGDMKAFEARAVKQLKRVRVTRSATNGARRKLERWAADNDTERRRDVKAVLRAARAELEGR